MAGVMAQGPAEMAALRQVEVLDADCGLPLLALDYRQVLSAWEKMGGEVDADPAFGNGSSLPVDWAYGNWIGQDARSISLAKECKYRTNDQEQQIWPVSAESAPVVLHSTGAVGGPSNWNSSEGVGNVLSASDQLMKGLLGVDLGGQSAAGVGVVSDGWPNEGLVDLVVGPPGSPLENVETKPVINEALMDAVNGMSQADSESSSALSTYMAASVAMSQGMAPTTASAAMPTVDSKSNNFVEVPQMSPTVASVGLSSSAATVPATSFVLPFASGMRRIPGSIWNTEGRTRKQCLQRYREKKARRMYAKKIRYELRKINADRRPRIKGRFVKKEELEKYMEQQALLKEKTTGPDLLEGSRPYDLDCGDICR